MSRRGWFLDLIVGIVLGGVVGAIVAVNFVIYTGVEDGYQASIADVFDHNALIGLITVAFLIGGPILGVVLARRQRRRSYVGSTEVHVS